MLRKLLIITCMLGATMAKAQAKTDYSDTTNYKALGAILPKFLVTKTDGTLLTNKDVKNKANLIVMLFNPTCSHCEDETKALEEHMSYFKNTKVLMVATSMMLPYIPNFEKTFKTDDYPTLMVTRDSLGITNKLFEYKMLPQLNIYDHNRRLIKVFYGETPVDSLKKYIE